MIDVSSLIRRNETKGSEYLAPLIYPYQIEELTPLYEGAARARARQLAGYRFRLPCPSVLSELNDSQKGQLLAAWLTVLQDLAGLLREVWEQSDMKQETMIVRRSNDSST
jgi:hypothetical protein